jgi:hypothetical protein
MIDLDEEHLITLRKAAESYPLGRQGKPAHVSTIRSHIMRGCRVRKGPTIHLEGIQWAGRLMTSTEAVRRFVERITAARLGQPDRPPPQMTERRRRELAHVDALLRAKGLAAPSREETP